MADDYWDHPSRRETKRLIDLADVGAILDELQNQTTEWDDAREALDHLVRAADLRAAASEDTWRRWAEARGNDTKAEVERLRAELDARTDERDDAMNGWKKAEAERDRLVAGLRKAAAYLYRRADLDADLSPSESRALATELRDATALGGTEAGR